MSVHYVYEPKRGQCHARNTGIAHAQGDILLWTDDDVRPPQNWIEGMCTPIIEGEKVVAGGVRIAPYLLRPWMTTVHRIWMASTEHIDTKNPQSAVGANMAFAREIFDEIPEFDTELGPGALGMGDDTLFLEQVKRAGYRIASALHIEVEHHFDPSRLLRSSFLDRAAKEGKTGGYLSYHWGHTKIRCPFLRMWLCRFQLLALRLIHLRRMPQN